MLKLLSNTFEQLSENLWEFKLKLQDVLDRKCQEITGLDGLNSEPPDQLLLIKRHHSLVALYGLHETQVLSKVAMAEMLSLCYFDIYLISKTR